MDSALEKMSLEGLYKIVDHVVGLMERAEHRTESGHRNAFRYLPKYSVLLRTKIGELGPNKKEVIEMRKVLYDDSYVRMLQTYEEAAGLPRHEGVMTTSAVEALSPSSEVPSTSPASEVPSMSPMSAMSPKSPGILNTFNLAAARAAKKAKRGGATRRKRSRRAVKCRTAVKC